MATKKKEVTLESLDSDIKSVKKEVENISERVSTLGTLEDYTPEEISQISRSGKAEEYFHIGDTKTITIDGKTYTATIIAFNHYKDIEGNICGITFQTLLNDDYPMNGDNTNKGGYVCSDLRQNLYRLYNNLDRDWKKVIRKTEIRTVINTHDDEADVFDCCDYLFIPSAYEIFGEHISSEEGMGNWSKEYLSKYLSTYKQEGTPIPYLYEHRVKGYWYWTRSSYLSASYYFWFVHSNGILNAYDASYSGGVALCWCI